VFSTKNRERTMSDDNKDVIYKYLWGVFKKNCHLYRIGGTNDHVHIVTHLHPSISLSALIKDLKLASSEYINKSELFKRFNGWHDGYRAFTYSFKEKINLIEYVKNQEQHHKHKSYLE
jgi:REP element-mobilizing transposase RayT